jgi:hypothetical protein
MQEPLVAELEVATDYPQLHSPIIGRPSQSNVFIWAYGTLYDVWKAL